MSDNSKLFSALARAQATVEVAVRDTVNKGLNTKYADIASVIAAVRDAAKTNELSIVIMPVGEPRIINHTLYKSRNGDRTIAECVLGISARIFHASGDSIEFQYSIPFQEWNAQGFGSALTYARRYAMLCLFNVATDDDDGNATVSGQPDENSEKPKAAVVRSKQLPPAPAPVKAAPPPRPVDLPEAFDPIEESVDSLHAAIDSAKDFEAMCFLNKDNAMSKLPEEIRIKAYQKWALLTSSLNEFDVVNKDKRLAILSGSARDEVKAHLDALKAANKKTAKQ